MTQRQQVVEPASAILGNERAIPINADHRNMVRFSPHEPEKYRPLKNVLKGIVGKIEAGISDSEALAMFLLIRSKTRHRIQRRWNTYRSSIVSITRIC